MSLTERAAYLRGLYDGLELDAGKSKEARLMSAIIDVLEEMASHVSENEESIMSLADQVDDLAEHVGDLGELFLDDDMEEDDMEEDDDFHTVIEAECPNCQRMLSIDEDALAEGEIECPTCGQRFSIDMEFEDVEDNDRDEMPF